LIEHYPNRGKGSGASLVLLEATQPSVVFGCRLSTPIDEASKLIEPIKAGEVDIAFGSPRA